MCFGLSRTFSLRSDCVWVFVPQLLHVSSLITSGEFHLSVPAEEVLHLQPVYVRRTHQVQTHQGYPLLQRNQGPVWSEGRKRLNICPNSLILPHQLHKLSIMIRCWIFAGKASWRWVRVSWKSIWQEIPWALIWCFVDMHSLFLFGAPFLGPHRPVWVCWMRMDANLCVSNFSRLNAE